MVRLEKIIKIRMWRCAFAARAIAALLSIAVFVPLGIGFDLLDHPLDRT